MKTKLISTANGHDRVTWKNVTTLVKNKLIKFQDTTTDQTHVVTIPAIPDNPNIYGKIWADSKPQHLLHIHHEYIQQ
jgi:hypothetical protein